LILEQFYANSELNSEIILCKPNKEPLFKLDKVENPNFDVQLAKMSQISFDYPYIKDDEVWNKLKGDYLIYLKLFDEKEIRYENYYIVSNILDIDEENTKKNILCNSSEFQIGNKRLTAFKGVKKLYRTPAEIATYTPSDNYPTLQSFIESGILNYIIETLNPNYSVNFIDSDLNSKFRYIEVDDSNCYEFILNVVQKVFECVCIFDNINNTISIKKYENIGLDRGLNINNHNYLKKLENNVRFEDVYTVLYLYGKDNITINGINATGSSALINLDYYKTRDYMSQDLIDALNSYEALLESKETVFSDLLSQLSNVNSQISTENQDLITLNIEKSALQETQQAIMYQDDQSALDAINAQIASKNSEIQAVENTISNLNDNKNTINNSITSLNNELSLENNFSTELIKERSYFIKETLVSDSAFFDANELKTFGENMLSRISYPSYEISIDAVDFLSDFDGKDRDRLNLGDIIYITDDKLDLKVKLKLVGYSYNIYSRELKLNFTNKNNINDKTIQISDLLKNAQSTTRSLDLKGYQYGDYYQNDKNKINDYITEELDLSAQGAKSGFNNNVTMDKFGFTATNLTDENKKIRMASDGIVITEDNFSTAKLAINSKGVFADAVFGRLLAGTNLQIETEDGNVSIDNDGFRVRDIDLEILSSTGNNKTIINAADGFKLQKKNGSIFEDLISTDSLGNLDMKGFLTVGDGNSIFKASDKGIHLGNAVFENAPFSVSLLGQLKATNADIDGIIRCKELYINDISTNAISNNKIKGDFLDGDSININSNPYLITVRNSTNTNATAISQNGDAIFLLSAGVDGNKSNISINSNSITAEVNNRTNADNILSTSITQNAQSIELKVNADGVINAINLSGEGVAINASKIDLNGITRVANTLQLGIIGDGTLTFGSSGASINTLNDPSTGTPTFYINSYSAINLSAPTVMANNNVLATQNWVFENFVPK